MFVHIVFMKFKDPNAIPTAKIRLETLKNTVPSIVELEVGIDILHSRRSKDLVLITRFKNEEGYQRYAVNPHHQTVLTWLKTQLIESSTVDYIQ
jgi:hypothetical protein